MKTALTILILIASSAAQAEPLRCDLHQYFPNEDINEVAAFDAQVLVNADGSASITVPQASLAKLSTAARTPAPYRSGENPMVDAAIEKLGLGTRVAGLERIHLMSAGNEIPDAALLRLLDESGNELNTLAFIEGAYGMGECNTGTLLLFGDPEFNPF